MIPDVTRRGFINWSGHMSYVNGWQEGAVRSAHYTVAQIAERVRARGAT